MFDVAGRGALPDSVDPRGGTDRIVTIADFRAERFGITFAACPQERSAEPAAEGVLIITVAATYPLAEAAVAQRDRARRARRAASCPRAAGPQRRGTRTRQAGPDGRGDMAARAG
ncbi:hypothetical protein ACTMTF_21405 [Nonomuraea sp. ZG12]|uniref:hypothetical protein n=1 Tax=Nonomuraea sp. ZG12 TaxID=3452207 RepID=UPI003F8CD9B1